MMINDRGLCIIALEWMELWLSREYFFWRIMKVSRIVLLATSESLQAAIK